MRNHFGSLRHHGLILIWALAAYWIASRQNAADTRALRNPFFLGLNLSLFLSVGVLAGTTYLETRYAFSGGQAAARFIRANDLTNRNFLATRSAVSESVLPYFKNLKFFYPEIERYGTYIHYNVEGWDSYLDEPDLIAALQRPSAPREPYLLLTFKLNDPDLLSAYRLVYESDPNDFVPYFGKQECYFLYEPASQNGVAP